MAGRRYARMMCMLICLLLCSGCGRASGDEIAADYRNEETASGGNADENLQETGKKHTQFEIVGRESYSVITVDADVEGLEKAKDMHFYNVTRPDMDETYIQTETAGFFDKDTCSFYKPYGCCNAEELAHTRAALQSDCEAEEDPVMKQGMEKEIAQLELWIGNEPDGTEVQPMGDVMYEEAFAGGYSSHYASAKGKIDGVPFVYEYWDSCGAEDADFYASMDLTRYDYIGEKQHVTRMSGETPALETDNIPVSREEAREQADAFLERIGYTDFSCSEIGYAENMTRLSEQTGQENENLAYSWFLVYSRGRDGLTAVCCPGTMLRCTLAGELQTGSEMLYVWVNADGVTRVKKFGAFYSVDAEGAKTESYLSWEQVEDAAGQYLQTYEMPAGCKSLTISRVELSYVYVRYQSGQYCMVPAWSFYGYNGSEGEHFIFGVNAVDGELITADYLIMVSGSFVL